MKAAGYRSFAKYDSRAKEEHVHMTNSWEVDLDRAFRSAIRSCNRGLGPARQSEALDLDKVQQERIEPVDGGARHPK